MIRLFTHPIFIMNLPHERICFGGLNNYIGKAQSQSLSFTACKTVFL